MREFGIRSALGAARHQVSGAVLGEGAVLGGLGVGLGAVAAAGLTRFIESQLIGVPTLDWMTYLAVATVLGTVVLAACWLPAWQAGQVDPIEALSSE